MTTRLLPYLTMTLSVHNRFEVLSSMDDRGESNQLVMPNHDTNVVPFLLTKQYFKLLQAIHHLEILKKASEDGILPPGMTRQISKLTKFIKPSSPNNATTTKVNLMTKQWMEGILGILLEHYDHTVATLLDTLGHFNLDAFDKAVRWARTRYRRKFTTSSADTARSLLQGQSPSDFPPLPSSTPPLFSSSGASPVIGVITKNRSSFADVVGKGSAPVLPPVQQEAVEINAPLPLLDISDHHVSPVDISPNSPLPCRTVDDLPPAPGTQRTQELGEETVIARTSSDTLDATRSNDVSPLLAQTLPLTNVAVVLDSSIECISPLADSSQSGEVDARLRAVSGRGLGESAVMQKPPSQVDLMAGLGGHAESSSHPSSGDGGAVAPLLHRPTRHANTTRKLVDWHLTVSKPIIFLGDSNLSRISSFTHKDIQIDSFPGATFHHLAVILDKLDRHPEVEVIVISAGIVNCVSEHESLTTWKQFLEVVRACKRVFPRAIMYVPLINYSRRLSKEVQELVSIFNSELERKFDRTIPLLDQTLFQTNARDGVHWLRRTANKMLEHWLSCLNL